MAGLAAVNENGRQRMPSQHRAAGIALITLTVLIASTSYAAEPAVFFREDFRNLENWRPLYFPKIPRHTSYTIETEGANHFLKAESYASASGLVFKKTFNISLYPQARWRWKVDNIYKKGDGRIKAGDDYPIRVYVLFQYNPAKAGVVQRAQYGAVRAIYGEYPPDSTLNYVWASKEPRGSIFTNPYTSRAKIVVLESGATDLGKWKDERVDILDDYRKAFGRRPPTTASLAIMNDSDNTKEKSVSYVEFIEIGK